MENLCRRDPSINVGLHDQRASAAACTRRCARFGKEDDVIMGVGRRRLPRACRTSPEGIIGATSQQYPLLMASLGIEAIKTWAETGEKPEPSPGLDFFNTGVNLVTDDPVRGRALDQRRGRLERCWGCTRG